MNNFNLFTDPLTGMSNFFALLECDMDSTFEDSGTIFYIDIVNLSGVNAKFGRETGDAYIKNLSEIINTEIIYKIPETIKVAVFRSSGDEFIIRLPAELSFDSERIERNINLELAERMYIIGVEGAGIRFSKLEYTSKITSVYELLRDCNIAMFKLKGAGKSDGDLPQWADWMIISMLKKVQETLKLLQYSNSLALEDEISGLPNHRAATIYLDVLYNEYIKNQSPFSVLFIDGDNLKKYNDLGYQYGNEMIRDIGKTITGVLRHEDKVFRWLSGDEFLVVLQDTSKQNAYILAERIRSQVEKAAQNWKYPVTISIGISSCPSDGQDLDTLLLKSAAANSAAKKSGKNCVK